MTLRRFIMGFFLLWSLMGFQCSRSSLFENTIKAPSSTIHGNVRLSDGADSEEICVWMEGFDLFTRTDSLGGFSLQMPDPSLQPGGGLSGEFNIYFYVANYRIDSVAVTIVEGHIESEPQIINDEGHLVEVVELQKLVQISSSILPDTIFETDSVNFKIIVNIRTFEPDVLIQAPVTPNDWLLAMIFRKAEERSGDATFYGSDTILYDKSIHQSAVWEMEIQSYWLSPRPGFTLESGLYDVVPFLIIKQDGIPEGLMDHLGENALSLHPDYLKIPVRFQNGRLTVLSPSMK